MKAHRVWLEIVLLGTAIAFALALLIATVGAVAGAAQTETQSQSQTQSQPQRVAQPGERIFEGMVTCSRCGARHSVTLARAADNCVRICVHNGGSFALVDAESSYILDGDPVALKKIAGQRARVVGVLTGKTIKMSSVSL